MIVPGRVDTLDTGSGRTMTAQRVTPGAYKILAALATIAGLARITTFARITGLARGTALARPAETARAETKATKKWSLVTG